MDNSGILAKTLKLISNLKIPSKAGASKFGKADFAVLKVAMMVSALDGEVQENEIVAFGNMAKKCRGYSPEAAEAALREGLHAAGYLTLQAKRLKEKDFIEEFVNEAIAALPEDLVIGRADDVRRAFVTWLSMAMSDEDYSQVERKAIMALVRRIAQIIGDRDEQEASLWREISPAYAVAYSDARKPFPRRQTPTEEFLTKAEALLGKLRRESTAAEALKALKALIANG